MPSTARNSPSPPPTQWDDASFIPDPCMSARARAEFRDFIAPTPALAVVGTEAQDTSGTAAVAESAYGANLSYASPSVALGVFAPDVVGFQATSPGLATETPLSSHAHAIGYDARVAPPSRLLTPPALR